MFKITSCRNGAMPKPRRAGLLFLWSGFKWILDKGDDGGIVSSSSLLYILFFCSSINSFLCDLGVVYKKKFIMMTKIIPKEVSGKVKLKLYVLICLLCANNKICQYSYLYVTFVPRVREFNCVWTVKIYIIKHLCTKFKQCKKSSKMFL